MSCNVSDFIDNILCQLNDQDAVGWTRKQIQSYINLGVSLISNRDIEGFSCVKEIKLTGPGCDFDLSEHCDEIIKVMVQDGECDTPIASSPGRNEIYNYFTERCLNPDKGYKLNRWDIEADNHLHIVPSLKRGEEVKLKIRCYESPSEYDTETVLPDRICSKYLVCLHEFVMAKAYGLYTTDPNLINLCQKQTQLFENCMATIQGAEFDDDDN